MVFSDVLRYDGRIHRAPTEIGRAQAPQDSNTF